MINGDNPRIPNVQKAALQLLTEIELRIKASNSNENQDLLTLHSVFGSILERALNIFEKHPILETYSPLHSKRMVIEIKGDNDRCYRIFPRVNFCPCLAFKHQVVVAKSQVTCKHVLAARLAIALGKTVDHELTLDQYLMLVKSMFENHI